MADDIISRQAAIDAVRKLKPFVVVEPGTTCVLGVGIKPAAVVEAIDTLPSAQRTGRWIWEKEGYHCSECHTYESTTNILVWNFKFCPNCGARMEENR